MQTQTMISKFHNVQYHTLNHTSILKYDENKTNHPLNEYEQMRVYYSQW